MGLSAIAVHWAVGSYAWEMAALVMLGVSSGLFIVPLNAYLQQRSESEEKGRMIATNNFYNTVGLLLASAILWGLHDKLHIAPQKLVLWCGIVTLAGTVYIVRLVPEFLMRFLLWMTMHTIYKIRIEGRENIPLHGPALLVSNHVTHLDGFFIAACMQRFVRFMVWKVFCDMKVVGTLLRFSKAIPAGTTGPRDVVASIHAARKQLQAGHVVCIFSEGAISRTGNLLPFKRGMEKIVDGLDVPIIPVHLDGLWGSVFSFEGGKFFWKWPKKIPYPMTVSFGSPMPASSSAHQVRQAIAELASGAVMNRKSKGDQLHLRFIRAARKNWSRFAMADSTGRELTYGRALTGIADRFEMGATTIVRNDRSVVAFVMRWCAGESRDHDGGQGSGEFEFHRWAGGDDGGDRAMLHSKHRHVENFPEESRDRGNAGDGLSRRYFREVRLESIRAADGAVGSEMDDREKMLARIRWPP